MTAAAVNFCREVGEKLGELPEGAELDRYLDNKGHYYIDNLHWASNRENSENTRNYHSQSWNAFTKKRTPAYRAWAHITYAYTNDVCDEWLCDWTSEREFRFKRFFDDMREKPPGAWLERHNKLLPFSKENCFWGKGVWRDPVTGERCKTYKSWSHLNTKCEEVRQLM